MKTPRQYLIKPVGQRYNNAKLIEGNELIVNATNDETDFKYTNRIGEVVGLPADNHANLEIGDKVIVHHNTFRKWFNVRGILKDSSNFVKEDLFSLDTDQIYAYDRGDGWKTIEDWIFVKPIELGEITLNETGKYQTQKGVVKIANDLVGEKVFFSEASEYVFEIDGEVLYRMREQDIMLLL